MGYLDRWGRGLGRGLRAYHFALDALEQVIDLSYLIGSAGNLHCDHAASLRYLHNHLSGSRCALIWLRRRGGRSGSTTRRALLLVITTTRKRYRLRCHIDYRGLLASVHVLLAESAFVHVTLQL